LLLILERLEKRLVLSDVSAPAILQIDDSSDSNLERRAADLFNAGYGAVLMPPPGRADSGNQSVGYDVYNRFDLGSPGNPTLYGTETGLKATISAIHQIGDSFYSDLVWNQDGFRDQTSVDSQGHSFVNAGGYPGFLLTSSFDYNGDFHDRNDTGDWNERLAGLIDIAQEKNYQYIRSPVDPSDPRNLPAGTVPAFGQLANVPDPSNNRFYPDRSLQPIIVYDPKTGEQNIHIYPFNTANPQNGTPVPENALGYLMRYAQWMVQDLGVDGFRLDAAKNMPPWVLNYYDRSVYRSSFRTLLNGRQEQVFSFGEVYDGNKSLVQQYIRKDINPNDPGTIGGNRDALDFPLFFAMRQNLSGNGLQNDWRNVVNASQDIQDDGLANNGSQGISFVSSADDFGPYLSNVAYALTLTRPGNALVYFNAKEFGNNRPFPKDGRGDALGGYYGDTITTLLNIRDSHPSGNYIQRDLEKEIDVYERDNSMIVALSNRLDAGYDSRTVHTDFAPGTPLIELTGNATDPNVDPDHAIPALLIVNADGTVNFRVPRNRNDLGQETDKGYAIWGLAGPQGNLSLTNVNQVLPGGNPTANTNGTTRLSNIDDITGDSFQINLDTNAVNLLGSYRDHDADGDNALFKIDDGVDVTGHGFVSTTPGNVAYGFQQFTDLHSPGYFNSDGNGHYSQTIDVSGLSDGMHYITVRAFRHRADGGPPVFTDFRQAIYINRHPPISTIVSFNPIVNGINENRRVSIQSVDQLADQVYVFLDLPAALTNDQVVVMIGTGSRANQIDRDMFTKDFFGLTNGNHVITVVTIKIDGSATVQRFSGWYTSTIFGAGLGDLNFDGRIDAQDINLFSQVMVSNNSQFNPAADMNGDGVIDNSDLLLLYPRLISFGVDQPTLDAYNQLLGPPEAGFSMQPGGSITFFTNQPTTTSPSLSFTWDINNLGLFDQSGASVTLTWDQLGAYGITGPGTYPITSEVTDGTNTVDFMVTLTVVGPTVSSSGPGMAVAFAQGLRAALPTAMGQSDRIWIGPSGVAANLLEQDWEQVSRQGIAIALASPQALGLPAKLAGSKSQNGWLEGLVPGIPEDDFVAIAKDSRFV
jgi:hypothetical protein